MSDPETWHGWFSAKAFALRPTASFHGAFGRTYVTYSKPGSVYRTAEGEEVVVTSVTREKQPVSSWGDEVYLGEVATFVRTATQEDLFRLRHGPRPGAAP